MTVLEKNGLALLNFPSNCPAPSHFDQILYFSFVLSINETAVNCGTGL